MEPLLTPPVIAAVTQGYGHLRAAAAIADGLGVDMAEIDRHPFAAPGERAVWSASRRLYVGVSRLSQAPAVGPAFRWLLNGLTAIPDSRSSMASGRGAVLLLDLLIRLGLGRRLAVRLERSGSPLVSTFYAPALAVDRGATIPVACLVTDSDAHRVWGPRDPAASRLTYLVPTQRAVARLAGWGVRPDRIVLTGFPLPPELVEPNGAGAAFTRRLARLAPGTRDAGAPRLMVAVGGAGAQAERGRQLSSRLAPLVRAGRLRLALVAGTSGAVAARFRRWLEEAGLGGVAADRVEVLWESSFMAYYRRFNRMLADTDILWTKPSELCFYAGLGVALVLDDPVGDHERCNRDWLLSLGAATIRQDPAAVDHWLPARLEDGSLAAAASNGFRHLPRSGTERIIAFLQSEFTTR